MSIDYLNLYLESVNALPEDLQRDFTRCRELDLKELDFFTQMEKDLKDFRENTGDAPRYESGDVPMDGATDAAVDGGSPPRLEKLDRLHALLQHVLRIEEEKQLVCAHLADLTTSHVLSLEKEHAAFLSGEYMLRTQQPVLPPSFRAPGPNLGNSSVAAHVPSGTTMKYNPGNPGQSTHNKPGPKPHANHDKKPQQKSTGEQAQRFRAQSQANTGGVTVKTAAAIKSPPSASTSTLVNGASAASTETDELAAQGGTPSQSQRTPQQGHATPAATLPAEQTSKKRPIKKETPKAAPAANAASTPVAALPAKKIDHRKKDKVVPKQEYCIPGCTVTVESPMVGCENAEDCVYGEWFHISCVGLSAVPGQKIKWYCNQCRPRGKK